MDAIKGSGSRNPSIEIRMRARVLAIERLGFISRIDMRSLWLIHSFIKFAATAFIIPDGRCGAPPAVWAAS